MTILELPQRVELELGSRTTPLMMSILRESISWQASDVESTVRSLDHYDWRGDYAYLQWTEARATVFQLLAVGLVENNLLPNSPEGREFKVKLSSNQLRCSDVLAQLGMEDARRARILGLAGYGKNLPMKFVIDYYNVMVFIEPRKEAIHA